MPSYSSKTGMGRQNSMRQALFEAVTMGQNAATATLQIIRRQRAVSTVILLFQNASKSYAL
jgi:hypothetical protein